MCDYVASKFAVYGLNESLRLDLARRGVKGVHTTVCMREASLLSADVAVVGFRLCAHTTSIRECLTA